MTQDSAARDDTGDEPAEGPSDAAESTAPGDGETPEEVNRRRFRQALDRKRAGHHGEGMSADPKTRSPHAAPAKPQRTFRRKSG